MAIRVALVGGGTGGHIYPLIAVAEEVIRQSSVAGIQAEVKIFGDNVSNASREAGIAHAGLFKAKWRHYFSLLNILDLFKIPFIFIQSLSYFWAYMPDIVFAKGGYTSVIPVLVAKFYMIPCVIHESDAIPGRANMLLDKFAEKIFLAFDSAKKFFPPRKTEIVGNPVRFHLLHAPHTEALAMYEFPQTKPIVIILGGSQGAKAINDAVIKAIVPLTAKFNVIHQVGRRNKKAVDDEVEKISKEGQNTYGQTIKNSYLSYAFLNTKELAMAYSAADIIVTRAGSGELFEAASLGKPVLVIPITKSSSGHQLANAQEVEKFGGIIIEEPNLTVNLLISQLVHAYEGRQELGQRIQQFAKPKASADIARSLIQMSS